MKVPKHHRQSIRLKGYDYCQPGWYFITICVQYRQMLFGEIINGQMILNEFGEIVKAEWFNTAKLRPYIELDEFIVMPNHIHGIIGIVDNNRKNTAHCVPTTEKFGKPVIGSIPTIVRAFKAAATKEINEKRFTPGASLWQRNYFEHIIRDEPELNRIRNYIIQNPRKWEVL